MTITTLLAGYETGLDDIFPEFLKHARLKVKEWLVTVFNAKIADGELPKAINYY